MRLELLTTFVICHWEVTKGRIPLGWESRGVPTRKDPRVGGDRRSAVSIYNISTSPYDERAMESSSNSQKTRQIYASVREDLYLAAKARATELRIPLRAFIEHALQLALTGQSDGAEDEPTTWDDVYLNMQAQQPLGSPVEPSDQEAGSVVRASFGLEVSGRSAGNQHRGKGPTDG